MVTSIMNNNNLFQYNNNNFINFNLNGTKIHRKRNQARTNIVVYPKPHRKANT